VPLATFSWHAATQVGWGERVAVVHANNPARPADTGVGQVAGVTAAVVLVPDLCPSRISNAL